MQRPLVFLALSFALGIFVSNLVKIHLPFYLLTIIFLIFSLLLVKKELSFDMFICCAIFFLGASSLKSYELLPRCHILNFISPGSDAFYSVKGFINTPPISRYNRVSFIFKAEELHLNNAKYRCCGDILVYGKDKQDLVYAQELILTGNLLRLSLYSNSKRSSYQRYLYNQGIRVIMHTKYISKRSYLNKNYRLTIRKFAFHLKKRIEEIISKRVSLLSAAILDAMLLGEKKNIPLFIIDSMVKTGTIHILVVSGFNVGIVAFACTLFLKLIRIPRMIRFYLASFLLIIYCLMTGASTPVVRATLMAVVFMSAYLIRRIADIYNSLALALVFVLWFNPYQLFDIGFQLSFISVISIVYLYPKLKSALKINTLKIYGAIRFFCEAFLVSLSAWLGTTGVVAYYFKIFSPVTVLANIFIAPLASLITLCGFSLVIMELIYPHLATLFAATCELLVSLLLGINSVLIKIPGAYFYLG